MDTRVGIPPEIWKRARKLIPLSNRAANVTLSPSMTAETAARSWPIIKSRVLS